jgi:hypothetical protein
MAVWQKCWFTNKNASRLLRISNKAADMHQRKIFKNSIAAILFTLCAKNQPAVHWHYSKQQKPNQTKEIIYNRELKIIMFYSKIVSFKLTILLYIITK